MPMASPIAFILLLSSLASGGIIEDIRGAIAQNNFSAASSELQAYRTQHGVDPEYLEALSWMARGSLAWCRHTLNTDIHCLAMGVCGAAAGRNGTNPALSICSPCTRGRSTTGTRLHRNHPPTVLLRPARYSRPRQ